MEAKELKPIESMPSSLSVRVTQNSLAELGEQRKLLKTFINKQLTRDIDYGIIPGTPKPSLYKPGAEKIANIFQLGSRVVKTDRVIDVANNFAMFEVTVEVFHLPTGKPISQCVGVCNNHEKKYKERAKYGKNDRGQREFIGMEETPFADVLNTLSKMAQKRAYVGAVIIATGASDYFTQDLTEGDDLPKEPGSTAPKPAPQSKPVSNPGDYVVKFGQKYKGQTLDQMGREEIVSFRAWLMDAAAKDNKPLGGAAKEFVEMADAWLASGEKGNSDKALG